MSGLKTLFRTSLTVSDDVNETDTLGDIRQEQFKRYKYVEFITNDVVAGDVVKYATCAAGYIASQVTDIATQNLAVAGVVLAAQNPSTLSDTTFGWIQIGGLSGVLKVDITNSPIVESAATGSATLSAFKQGAGESGHCGTIMDAGAGVMRVLLKCVD